MKIFSLILLLVLTINLSFAGVIIVQNTNDSGAGTLRQAVIDAQVSDTIRFSPSLISNGNDTIKLNSEIAFSKGLFIKGLFNSSDTLFISGQNAVRIFNVDLATSSMKNLMIDSLCLIQGRAQGVSGGALKFINGDTLFVHNSILKNNFTSTYGGGIYAEYNTRLVEILNSTIRNNTALFSGGGLLAPTNIKITNSHIDQNTANNDGGGIYGQLNSPFTITISNSSISNNSAQFGAGGGIYSSNRFSTVTIDSSIVNNNSAQLRGGAICSFANSGHPDSLAVSTVIVNHSEVSYNATNDDGGGVCSFAAFPFSYQFSASSVQVTNSTMVGNSAANDGAGIFSVSHSTSSVILDGSTIADCVSGGKGGGVYALSDSSSTSVSLLRSTISDNTASFDGAAIFTSGLVNATTSVTNSTIVYNTTIGSNGGAVSSFADSLISSIDVKSSIVALNAGGNIMNSEAPVLNSLGHNIFSDSPAGYLPDNDQIEVDGTSLNLMPFAYYGGTVQNRMPGAFSVAKNTGDPDDASDAQNGLIIGLRDVGASESCISTRIDTVVACGNYLFGTESYSVGGVYYDTLVNVISCDSVIRLNLTIHPIYETELTQMFICPNDSVLIFGNYQSTPGLYYDSLLTIHGCDSVMVQELIIQPINTTVTLDGLNLTSNQANATYQWIDCAHDNILIEGATSQTFTATINGEYAVVITTANCSDTSDCIIIDTIDIGDDGSKSSLSVYPNPSNGATSFTIANLDNRACTIQMFEPDGRLVFDQSISGQQSAIIDVPELSNGLKIIKVTQEGRSVQVLEYVVTN
jgi:hypothetical protein